MIDFEMTARQKEYLETIPERYQGTYIRALTTGSKPALIRAMCLHCVGYEDVIKSIKSCRCEICPQYHVRSGAGDELPIDDSPKPSVPARKVEK